jgi:choline dehydrogenase
MGFNPCKPTSKGHLEIQSSDPFEHPKMHGNYLDTEYDQQVMIAGVHMMRKLAKMPALAEIIESEFYPGMAVQSDDEILSYIREKAWTVFHQCGTCRMNDDPALGVVDGRLRVHGIEGLRIADASIFPTIPTGNTNAPAMMVGEMAADLIRADRV